MTACRTVPLDPADLRAGWFEELLAASGCRDPRIARVEVEALNAGAVGRLFRVRLEHEDDAAAGPRSLIAKLPAAPGPTLDLARSFRLYEREARFYAELASEVSLPVPRHWFADGTAAGDYAVVIEDAGDGLEGDLTAGIAPERLDAILERLADTHARFWEDGETASLAWLPRPNDPITLRFAGGIEAAWETCRRRWPQFVTPAVRAPGTALRHYGLVLQELSSSPCTLTHGDLRANNMLFEVERGDLVAVIDWQSATYGRASLDLASLIVGNLEPAERRATERALVTRYHQALVERGVRGYDAARCWEDYRTGAFAQFAQVVGLGAFVDLGGGNPVLERAIVGRPFAAVADLGIPEVVPRASLQARLRTRLSPLRAHLSGLRGRRR